jgi:hypothetical protein
MGKSVLKTRYQYHPHSTAQFVQKSVIYPPKSKAKQINREKNVLTSQFRVIYTFPGILIYYRTGTQVRHRIYELFHFLALELKNARDPNASTYWTRDTSLPTTAIVS